MRQKPKPIYILLLSVLFWLLSINQWEYYFYEPKLFPLILAISSSIAYLLSIVVIEKTKSSIKIVSRIFIVIYIVVISFDLIADCIKSVTKDFTESVVVDTLCNNVSSENMSTSTIDHQKINVLGIKNNTFLNRYMPIQSSISMEDDSSILKCIPGWFFRFADVVAPLKHSIVNINSVENKHNAGYYFSRRFGNYLLWQYPEYDIVVVVTDANSGIKVDERYLYHCKYPTYSDKKERVYCPYPILRQLLKEHDELIYRFYTYRNIILYTFNSPFTRDLSRYRNIFQKRTLTDADIDSLGLNKKQKRVFKESLKTM